LTDIDAINRYLQERIKRDGIDGVEVSANEAARWLDKAGLLRDEPEKPGLPLRNLLRAGRITGQEQRPNQKYGLWFIRCIGA
jgi:hypothetical protein